MKIYANQLNSNLNQGLSNCYMLFGDEPFQIDNGRRKIKNKAKQQGFEEFIRLTDDDQFDWNELLDHCQAMSLFSSTKLIELELTSGKIPKAGADILKQVAEQLSADTIFVLFGPKLDSSQTRTAWFKALDKQGLYVPVYDIDGAHLQRWLQEQLAEKQMQMSRDAQMYLLDFTAGNLLACAQEVEKISLAKPNQLIELNDVKQLVADQSRYSVFQLVDNLWLGNATKCITILERLKNEELEPNIIMWALQKDIMLVYEISLAIQHQQNPQAILDKHRVWKNKQKSFLNNGQKIPAEVLATAVKLLSEIDQVIKFHQSPCPYSLFAHVCLLLTGSVQLQSVPLPVDLELIS